MNLIVCCRGWCLEINPVEQKRLNQRRVQRKFNQQHYQHHKYRKNDLERWYHHFKEIYKYFEDWHENCKRKFSESFFKNNFDIRHVQRTSAEHEQIFQIMTQFPEFMALDPKPDLLRQAIEVAHLEICEESRQPGLILQFVFFHLLELVF